MKNTLAKNKCCDCSHEWQDRPGGWAQVRSMTGLDMDGHEKWEAVCPECKSFYFVWTNRVEA